MVRAWSRRLTSLAVVAAGVAGLAGCGGGHAVRAGTPPTTAPATPRPTAPPVTATPPTSRGGPTTTLPPMTPTGPAAALFRAALADGMAARWVHGVSVSPAVAGGAAATTFVSDDGPALGTQDITIGAVSGHIRVVGTRTYIRGTAEAMVDIFLVPPAVALRTTDTWFVLRPADREYSTVTVGVTISSFLQEIAFSGTVTEGAARLAGTPVTVIRGALASSAGEGTGALYVSDGPAPLPLEWKQVGPGGTNTTTFSAWGRVVPVAAPSGAVPLPGAPAATVTLGIVRP